MQIIDCLMKHPQIWKFMETDVEWVQNLVLRKERDLLPFLPIVLPLPHQNDRRENIFFSLSLYSEVEWTNEPKRGSDKETLSIWLSLLVPCCCRKSEEISRCRVTKVFECYCRRTGGRIYFPRLWHFWPEREWERERTLTTTLAPVHTVSKTATNPMTLSTNARDRYLTTKKKLMKLCFVLEHCNRFIVYFQYCKIHVRTCICKIYV